MGTLVNVFRIIPELRIFLSLTLKKNPPLNPDSGRLLYVYLLSFIIRMSKKDI